MSSLDTLLQAADYLERLERAGSTDAKRTSLNGGDGLAGGHLFLDPNLPISFQFHTYSSPTPTNGIAGGHSAPIAIAAAATANGHHAHHQNGGQVGAARPGTILFPGHPTSNSAPTIGYLASTNNNSNGLSISAAGQQHHSASTKQHKNNAGMAGSLTVATAAVRPTGGRGSGGRGRGISESSDKDSVASSRHRELHKTLEKNRRAHLRHCFEQLKTELPKSEYNDKKTSHINIIHCAIRYIQTLKRMEYENEHEIERLARTKIRHQNQLKQSEEEILQMPNAPARSQLNDLLKQTADRVLNSTALTAGMAIASLNSSSTGNINIKRESNNKSVITSTGSSPLSRTSSLSNGSPPSVAAASLKSLSLVSQRPLGNVTIAHAIPTSVVVANNSNNTAAVLALTAAAGLRRNGTSSGGSGTPVEAKSEDDTTSDTNGDVIVELEMGEEYDDETTTTASAECADDMRDLCPPVRGRFGGLVTAEHAIHA